MKFIVLYTSRCTSIFDEFLSYSICIALKLSNSALLLNVSSRPKIENLMNWYVIQSLLSFALNCCAFFPK